MPKRIQRQRTRGWRMPEGAVYVGRPTKFGNPFRIGECYQRVMVGNVETYAVQIGRRVDGYERIVTAEQAVGWFRWWMNCEWAMRPAETELLETLRGKDLACWCPLVDKDGQPVPCHADVLLELANG